MKKYVILAMVFFCLATTVNSKAEQSRQLDNVFYPFSNAVRLLEGDPEDLEDRVALIKEIGYYGLAGVGGNGYYEWREAMDKVGLEMPEIYIRMGIDEDHQATYDGELKNIIKDSKDRNLLITFVLYNDLDLDSHLADQVFIEGIQEIADYANPYNVKVAIYPHHALHGEKISHAVDMARAINRRNAGIAFNLCHYLKVEGSEGWRESIEAAFPYIFMVSIHGADTGDTQKMGWDRLIQPLGEGSFDVYELVAFLRDKGYEGQFGLQCYTVELDFEEALTKAMETWKSFQERYQNEKQ